MKRFYLLALGLLFLSSTGMVLADATTASKIVKPVKSHHKKGKKLKSELNPQPLPPRKVPVDGAQAGPGGLKPQQ